MHQLHFEPLLIVLQSPVATFLKDQQPDQTNNSRNWTVVAGLSKIGPVQLLVASLD